MQFLFCRRRGLSALYFVNGKRKAENGKLFPRPPIYSKSSMVRPLTTTQKLLMGEGILCKAPPSFKIVNG